MHRYERIANSKVQKFLFSCMWVCVRVAIEIIWRRSLIVISPHQSFPVGSYMRLWIRIQPVLVLRAFSKPSGKGHPRGGRLNVGLIISDERTVECHTDVITHGFWYPKSLGLLNSFSAVAVIQLIITVSGWIGSYCAIKGRTMVIPQSVSLWCVIQVDLHGNWKFVVPPSTPASSVGRCVREIRKVLLILSFLSLARLWSIILRGQRAMPRDAMQRGRCPSMMQLGSSEVAVFGWPTRSGTAAAAAACPPPCLLLLPLCFGGPTRRMVRRLRLTMG